jgi:arylsulfatase A-like enzyme
VAPRLTRRETLRLLGVSAAGLAVSSSRPAARSVPSSPPNIVVFLTDDQRADAMSIAGNQILKTPNMDRIAAAGVRFSEMFVTNALCAPSRASFLTGLYSHAHGVITNGDGPDFVDQKGIEGQKTFVHRLRSAGYYTGLVGKWHILSAPKGFDQYVMLPGQGQYFDPDVIANGVVVKTRGHVEDVIGDQALAFLRGAPKDRPFLLLCWFKAPHRSWEPAPRFARVFEDVEVPAPRTFEDRLEGRPEALRRAAMALADMGDFAERGVPKTLPAEERKRRNLQALVKNYYRTLLGVDENVGRVLDELEKKELASQTAVFYTSDNGFFLGEHGLFDKRLMYEPSIRVPMLVRFPPRFPAGRVEARRLVLNVDLAPTLLELAGAPVPDGLHGRSFLPLAEGRDAPWRQDFLYEYYEYPGPHCVRKNRGVRTDRWKLIHFWEQPEEWELYDLQTDPDETVNLAGRREQRERVYRLRGRMTELRREVGDADPPGPAPAAKPCDLPP